MSSERSYRLELERQRATARTVFWNSVLIDVITQCEPETNVPALIARIVDEYKAEAK